MGKANNPQLERERAVYSYLDALESGDIDGIIESLQQAVYDAPLDQMLVDAHQAYFQEEQVQQDELAEIETQTTLSMPVVPLRPRGEKRNQKSRRRTPVWLQTLAAVLIVGALFGSFMAVLAVHNAANPGKSTPGASPLPACYPLRRFDTQNNVPTSASSFNALAAVAAISANDAWAVGSAYSSPNLRPVQTTFIEHWDGKSWQVVPSPNSADGNGSLNAVAAVSTNDVWAVGSSLHGTVPQGASSLSYSRTLVEHWDGKSWQIVPGPNSITGNGQLNSLVAVSQTDIWVVGSFADSQQTAHLFLAQWDGEQWHYNRDAWLPVARDGSTPVSLTSIAAISANDIWAVGASRSASGKQNVGLIVHWDGSRWQLESAPPGSQTLDGISALSARDIWVYGFDEHMQPLVEHWDGQQWSNVALPEAQRNVYTSLRGIKAISAHDVWVAGYGESASQAQADAQAGGSMHVQMLLLHWDGNTWQQIPVPTLQVSPSESLNATFAHALAVSDGQMWIVGIANMGEGNPLSIIWGQRICP